MQMPDRGTSNDIQLGAQGRVVIPAHLRRQLKLKPGDHLVIRREGDSIVLEPRAAVAARLLARFSSVPADISLVDELLTERRNEAAREDGEP